MGGSLTVILRDLHNSDRLAPLAMPDQDLRRPFRDTNAPGLAPQNGIIRLRLFLFALPGVMTGALVWAYVGWFSIAGTLSVPAAILTVLTAFTFFWVALSVGTALVGLFQPRTPRLASRIGVPGIDVAILLPMYGEPANSTIETSTALLLSLDGQDHTHRFSLHVLSDSRSTDARASEDLVVRSMQKLYPHLDIHYRWRPENTDYKSGNLREWVTSKGGAYEAILILDADSVMDRETVLCLTDEMACDPAVGLLQTIPRLLPGRTLWQRTQEFSARVYGVTLGRGFARWAGNAANFMGHNALVRTRAFAACAGLPKLPGRRPLGGVILSHDFVEAALIRRAGWGVRMLPDAAGSFEDTPETTVGYIRRDRRWCQGNMQHLRIIGAAGLNPMSRFHLMQGAMSYLSSVTWFVLLMLWIVVGDDTMPSALLYFAGDNPQLPSWPQLPWVSHAMLAGAIVLTLMLPKLIGAIDFIRRGGLGRRQILPFIVSMLAEVAVSVICAPMMMVQHVRAVSRTFAGFDTGWVPHVSGRPRLADLLRFHAAETVTGMALLALAFAGLVSLWLVPIALCLALAAPISGILAADTRRWPLFRFDQKRAGGLSKLRPPAPRTQKAM